MPVVRDVPVLGPDDAARRWLAGVREEVVVPRAAATVMLVRGAPPEVFMLRRTPTMEFAPEAWVFPGGGVDSRDADLDLPWAGPSPAVWAEHLRCDEVAARELVAAAVRELFEETAVLLAGPSADEIVTDVIGGEWDDVRLDLADRRLSLDEMLTEHGLLLRSDLLRFRGHWVTPEHSPRRYDTIIFSAAVPAGQTPDVVTSEADSGEWVRPAELIEAHHRGEAQLLTPTLFALEDLERAGSAVAFQDLPAVPEVITPYLVEVDGEPVMRVELP